MKTKNLFLSLIYFIDGGLIFWYGIPEIIDGTQSNILFYLILMVVLVTGLLYILTGVKQNFNFKTNYSISITSVMFLVYFAAYFIDKFQIFSPSGAMSWSLTLVATILLIFGVVISPTLMFQGFFTKK